MHEKSNILAYLSYINEGDWDKIYGNIRNKKTFDLDEIDRTVKLINSKFVTILDEDYPQILKNVYKPPFVLYYHGDLSLAKNYEKCLSVIGSRDCSNYAIKATQHLLKGLLDRYNIVSGLALGIDAVAHEFALDNGGKTIAILGSGINYCHPKTNLDLYKKIKDKGLILSEYPNELAPKPEYFPFRNRIVAALSKGLLVAEAKARSGSLVSVMYATSLSRDIFCPPYSIFSECECNHIIKDGAFLVTTSEDIIEVLKWK